MNELEVLLVTIDDANHHANHLTSILEYLLRQLEEDDLKAVLDKDKRVRANELTSNAHNHLQSSKKQLELLDYFLRPYLDESHD